MSAKGLLFRDRDGTSNFLKWKEISQIISLFFFFFLSFSTPAGWCQPSYPGCGHLCRKGGTVGVHPKQDSAPPWTCAPQGGTCLGGHMGTDWQWSVYLCSTLQLDRLTWWARHKKAPAINLENGQGEAEETKPEEREKDLVETAASGDMEEAGRDLPVNKHTHGLGVHCQHPMQTPKVHEGPPGAFTGAGACIYSVKDVTNENVLGPPNTPWCHISLNGSGEHQNSSRVWGDQETPGADMCTLWMSGMNTQASLFSFPWCQQDLFTFH